MGVLFHCPNFLDNISLLGNILRKRGNAIGEADTALGFFRNVLKRQGIVIEIVELEEILLAYMQFVSW
jgi:hypothetical protein